MGRPRRWPPRLLQGGLLGQVWWPDARRELHTHRCTPVLHTHNGKKTPCRTLLRAQCTPVLHSQNEKKTPCRTLLRARLQPRGGRKVRLPDLLQGGLPGEVGRPGARRELGVRRVRRHEERQRQRHAARRQRRRQRLQQPPRVALLCSAVMD